MPHVTFIYPCVGRFPETRYVRSWQMEPLSIGILSALTPKNWGKSFYDDRLEPIDYSRPTNLAAISIETFTARRGYQIAEEYHKRKIPVVVGGYHATLCFAEAAEHADAVCLGEAEGVWPQILNDVSDGNLSKFYQAPKSRNSSSANPDRSIFLGKNYFKLALVESGRGCRFNCSFCSISAFYRSTYRRRPVEEIVGEIKQLKEKTIFFVDDNIIGDLGTSRELFKSLKPLKINWIGQCSINAAADPGLLDLIHESGCRGLLVGFESLYRDNLKMIGKNINQTIDYAQAIKAFHQKGIILYGTFMFGFPGDSHNSILKTVDFAQRQKLFLSAFAQIIPFPGTPLYSQMEAERSLMYPSWWLNESYRFGQAPFYPSCMTPAALEQACFRARKAFYSIPSILKRGAISSVNTSNLRSSSVFYTLNYLMHREVSQKFGLPLGLRKSSKSSKSNHVVAEMANPSHDAEIRNLLWRISFPGPIGISYLRDPSYFDSLKIEGRHSDVIIGRDTATGNIMGLGSRSTKNVFINGELSAAGYLSSLRLLDDYRSSVYLARGYRELKRLHDAANVKLYLTTIIENNYSAREILTSGRAGLPTYHDIGRFCTLAIKPKQNHPRELTKELHLQPAAVTDIPAIIEFWRREGPEKQFFPEYSETDLTGENGLLKGIKVEDILVAWHRNVIVGTAAVWDQKSFRQSRITGYRGWLRFVRPLYNSAAALLSYPRFPSAGTNLNYCYLALVCVQNNDLSIFDILLSNIMSNVCNRCDFLLAGLHERDTLLPLLQKYRHFSYPSRLYTVYWPDGQHDFQRLDGRVPYLELGAL